MFWYGLKITASSELRTSFFLGDPWGWDVSWSQIANTEQVASSRRGVFKGKYC